MEEAEAEESKSYFLKVIEKFNQEKKSVNDYVDCTFIAGTSMSCERLFSVAGNVMVDNWNILRL